LEVYKWGGTEYLGRFQEYEIENCSEHKNTK